MTQTILIHVESFILSFRVRTRNGIGLHLYLSVLHFGGYRSVVFLVCLDCSSLGWGSQCWTYLELRSDLPNLQQMFTLLSCKDSSEVMTRALAYELYLYPKISLSAPFWMPSSLFVCAVVRPECQTGTAYSTSGRMYPL